MPKKYTVEGMEVELDDDISPKDLDKHPEPSNALSKEKLDEIEADESTLGE